MQAVEVQTVRLSRHVVVEAHRLISAVLSLLAGVSRVQSGLRGRLWSTLASIVISVGLLG